MIEHEDGSVTLSREQFKTVAQFLEMREVNLKELLTEKGDELTQDELADRIVQIVSLHLVEPHAQPN
jgi:hypothetical protein